MQTHGDVGDTVATQIGPGAADAIATASSRMPSLASAHVQRIAMYHDVDIVYHWPGESATILFLPAGSLKTDEVTQIAGRRGGMEAISRTTSGHASLLGTCVQPLMLEKGS
jgi:hypothetical protein